MSSRSGLTALRLVLGVVIAAYSVQLLLTQIHHRKHHALLILGLAELLGALLFLIPKTIWLGGVTLMLVFAAASAFHLFHGEYSNIGYLAVYFAAAFVVVSGRAHA